MSEKRRVVGYARVSTDKEEQEKSLDNQITFFQRELEKNKNYRFIKINHEGLCKSGVYYDEGISGTKLSRPGFDQLLLDAGLKPIIDADTDKVTTAYKIVSKPKFEMIYVKDTSRFSRNTSINDILQTLKNNGVYVYFLELNKSTERSEDMTVIQLFFSLAERESRDKSRKVKFGYEEGTRNGKIYVGGRIIGYDYIAKENRLVANSDADLVRLVFDLYTEEGLGHQLICNRLAEMGYFNSKGNKYTRSTISRMLENEKYTGITNTGRYTKPDLFSHKQIERDYDDVLRVQAREAQKQLLEQGIEKIEPIISVEQFQKAKQIRESNMIKNGVTKTYHGTTVYAQKIKCGCCGTFYTAQSRKYNKETKSYIRYYACGHRFAYDEYNGVPKCNNPSIREDKLDKFINSEQFYRYRLSAITELLEMSDLYISRISEFIDRNNEVQIKELQKHVSALEKKRDRLVDLYSDGAFDKETLKEKNRIITEQISEYTNRINELSEGNEAIYHKIEEVNELTKEARIEYKNITKYIETQSYPNIDRRALLRDVDYITVEETGRINFVFKTTSAIQITVLRLGEDLEKYAELEEIGWEKELELVEV